MSNKWIGYVLAGLLMLPVVSGHPVSAQTASGLGGRLRALGRPDDECVASELVRSTLRRSRSVERPRFRDRITETPPAVPEPAVAEPSVAYPDVRYARLDGVESHLLSMDIYAPPGARNCPVMVYVHGGAWSFGDKLATGNKVPYFTSRGWILVSINYRLLPAADPLIQVDDVARAVAWVHDRIDRYGGDPNELFLMGHSAGAHLVSLVATDLRRLKQAGKPCSILRGVIELDTAALDIVTLMETSADFYTRFFGRNRRRWKEASPIAHIAADRPIPPFLLAVAAGNESKLTQARRFAAALQEAGVRAEILEAPDKTHSTLNRDLGAEGDETTVTVMKFIESIRNHRSVTEENSS